MSTTQIDKPMNSRETDARSTVLDRSRDSSRPATALRPSTTPRPATRKEPTEPKQAPRPNYDPRIVESVRSAKQRRVADVLRTLGGRTMLFAGVFGATYLVSTLNGQVQMEAARRQQITAIERAQSARRAESGLRHEIDAMTSSTAIDRWAATHGFVAPDGTPAGTPAGTGAKPGSEPDEAPKLAALKTKKTANPDDADM